MGKQYIRVKKDGFIYGYNEILAKNPECEVVDEADIIPPQDVVDQIVAKRSGRQRAALDLTTADIPEPPTHTPPELAADAARKLPK
jgi:hypothetical protein